jgi:hypothetical protein
LLAMLRLASGPGECPSAVGVPDASQRVLGTAACSSAQSSA